MASGSASVKNPPWVAAIARIAEHQYLHVE
jgi:hypothetical protein